MALSVRNDPKRPFGGHAILEGPDLASVSTLTLENVYSGLFLAEDGRWTRQPHVFAVAHAAGDAGSLSLGPDIVDFVPAELQLAVRSGEGHDLGRLFWLDVIPSRSTRPPRQGNVREPVSAPSIAPPPAPEPPPSAPEPPPAAPEPPPAAPGPPPAEPARVEIDPPSVQPRRPRPRFVFAGLVLTMLLLAGAAAYAVRPRPKPFTPVVAGRVAPGCAQDFGNRLAAAREASDDDRVKLAEDAIAAGCGWHAFGALDSADWETSEAAAWYLARFYDPNEVSPVFRQTAQPHPDWAAAYYARWADRSTRHAAALKLLCRSDASAFVENEQLKKACAR